MPGIIHNNNNDKFLAVPDRFNPFDTSVFEWIWGDEAPDEDTFAWESGHAFLAGYLKDPAALFDCLTYFVGYSETTGDQYRVHRWNPAVHPRWPMLRCSQVSVKGVKYDGTTSTLRVFADGKKALPCTNYALYRFDCTFTQPEFDYQEDANVSTEWDRCVTVDSTDMNEIIQVDGGFYRINAPSATAINAVPPVMNGPFLKVWAQRSGLIIESFGLPADFILNQYGLPLHFMAAKGKVNSTTFLGLPAETMLLQNYKIVKRAQPLATKAVGALQYGLRIHMDFGFTDPDRAEPTETLRGWQLVPVIASGSGAGYYGVRSAPIPGGPPGNDPLYASYDMNKLLQYVNT